MMFSCKKDSFTVTAIAKGVKDGTKVILEAPNEDGTGLTVIDSTVVKDEKFELKGKALEPSFHDIQIEGTQGSIPFILENDDIKIEVYKDSIDKSKVSGTYNIDEYNKFNTEMIAIQKKVSDFKKNNNEIMGKAQETNDTVVINKLMKEFASIREEVSKNSKNKYISYVENHPKSFITVLILRGLINDPSTDFKKSETIFKGLDDVLKNTKAGKDIQKIIDEKNKPAAKTEAAPAPKEEASKWRTDFSGPNPDGKIIHLKNLLGKVTIVDFWASWCGPCRAESPNVVKIYKEFHSKGLNIVGVSLDKDAAKWKKAIADDGLIWNHISNLKYWDEPIAKQYKVEGIPATFILDAEGNIIAQNLTGEELRSKIESLLK